MVKSPTKINLMHIVLSLVAGGLERLVVEIALRMDRRVFNVEVCCFNELGHFGEILKDSGVSITLLPKSVVYHNLFYPFSLRAFSLKRILKAKNIHILHMHSGTFFVSTQAGVLARTPARIYTDHGRAMLDTRKRLIEDRISGLFVDKVIAVSNDLKDYLIDVVKLPRKKVVTVINGINTDIFFPHTRKPELLDEFHIPRNCQVIGTVGRLDKVKDQVSLLKAFGKVHEKIPETVLMFVGDGPMKQCLTDLAVEKNLKDSVIFTGIRKDIPDLLNLFDVFVLSSLSEGTSISLLEAMASGVSPVVTNVGGNPSVVDHMINGIVVEAERTTQLAEAIIDVLLDETKRGQFGRNAVRKVRDNYGIERMVRDYTSIYLELLGKRKKFRHLAAK